MTPEGDDATDLFMQASSLSDRYLACGVGNTSTESIEVDLDTFCSSSPVLQDTDYASEEVDDLVAD